MRRSIAAILAVLTVLNGLTMLLAGAADAAHLTA
jgi:hypothetical protein